MQRRSFLAAAAVALVWPVARAFGEVGSKGAAAVASEGDAAAPADFGAAHGALLEKSGFVYVSPLLADGRESACHGEVWYGWLDGAVVVITAAKTWKGRALDGGLDGARVWVGDHGRWKKMVGRNEEFRKAPHFDAKAVAVRDDGLLERLLALYEEKYPEEIGRWRDKMRAGYRDGSRLLIRYAPVS